MASLSWNEIRNRAHQFVAEWKSEQSEAAESQSFWNDFFHIFGIKRRRIVIFQKKAVRLSNVSGKGKIDAFWPGNILIEHKSYGEDLVSATQQAEDYFSGLRDAELPRAILVCDFERFNFIDIDNNGQETQFSLEELPGKVELFGFLAGYEKQEIRAEFDLNLQATKLIYRHPDDQSCNKERSVADSSRSNLDTTLWITRIFTHAKPYQKTGILSDHSSTRFLEPNLLEFRKNKDDT